jgi:hypothetical protein
MSEHQNDAVRVTRARIAKYNLLANRIGYLFWAVAISCFVMAFAFGFKGPLVTAVTVFIIIGSILLAPAIVLGYAIKSAEKEDKLNGV